MRYNPEFPHTLYTVVRCKIDDTLYGPSHGSTDGYNTVCEQKIDHHWYITNNTFDGEITCKRCLKIIRGR